MKNYAVIGGGILGLAMGYQILRLYPRSKVVIFEKEKAIGQHQSGNNSGVLHCGLHYKPGSLKAKLAVDGIKEMISFCQENEISHDICGKVVVATDENEINLLENLAQRGSRNGLSGLKFLTKSELKLREPHVFAKKALLVPEEGIVDYKMVMNTMLNKIKERGGEIFFESKIDSITLTNSRTRVISANKIEKEFDYIVNCTGLHSDRVYKNLTKKNSPLKIVPFRGEYLNIEERYNHIVNNLIYPVPDPKYPFLGVHFTRLINGCREVGPNAVFAFKREGYSNLDFSLRDSIDSLTYKGFINFISQNRKFAVKEFISSFSKKAFVNKAKKLIPDIEDFMLVKGGTAGVRAQAMNSDGELIMDFQIIRETNQIHILNAPSPGATASLSIAEYVVKNYIPF